MGGFFRLDGIDGLLSRGCLEEEREEITDHRRWLKSTLDVAVFYPDLDPEFSCSLYLLCPNST
jgi:hypothetical protein